MKKLFRKSTLPPSEIVKWLKRRPLLTIRKYYLLNELGAACQNGDDPQGVGEKYLIQTLKARGKEARKIAYICLVNQPNDKHLEILKEFRLEDRNACLLSDIDRRLSEDS